MSTRHLPRPSAAGARPTRRHLLGTGLALPVLTLAACADPVDLDGGNAELAQAPGSEDAPREIDISGTQELIRSTADENIAALLPDELREAGSVRVGQLSNSAPPLSFVAADNTTRIGAEIDIARIVCDKLGLEMEMIPTSWDNWPLALGAGDLHVMHANIGINPERIQLYDFASYRTANLGFLYPEGAEYELTLDPASAEGLTVGVSPGTNQEQVLRDWRAAQEQQGLTPLTIQPYQDQAEAVVALQAGNMDAFFLYYPGSSYIAATTENLATSEPISESGSASSLIAATVMQGSGYAEPWSAALNAVISEGTYLEVLSRWGLEDEAVTASRVHTVEYP